MDDFVVRQRQHEVFGERIEEAERDPVVMPAPVHRDLVQVLQRIVHPPHVPLEAEAEPAAVGRLRHAGPGRRFLGDHHGARMPCVDRLVQPAQKRDRLEILVPALAVGYPVAGLARIVEVEHRGDGVDAQPVDVVAVEPEEGVGDQVIGDFVAPEIEDRGIPVGMEALPRILVLVQRGAVESREAMRIDRKMRGHPVEQHTQPRAMRAIDEAREGRRLAEAAGRREQPDRLVAP